MDLDIIALRWAKRENLERLARSLRVVLPTGSGDGTWSYQRGTIERAEPRKRGGCRWCGAVISAADRAIKKCPERDDDLCEARQS